MDAKQAIITLLETYYEPCSRLDEADFSVTAVSLFMKLREVIPDLESPSLVASCLHELGYVIADEGELEFVWLLKNKRVL